MFLASLRTTSFAVIEIFILGAIGFFLVRKEKLNKEGLDVISRLVIELTLPLLIFCQLIKNFTFGQYPNWWIFPLIGIGVNIFGLLIGFLFSFFVKETECKMQFLGLITFQNSGYLPLTLACALLPGEQITYMFTYIFLFLVGFNIMVWTLGVYLLTFNPKNKPTINNLINPPLIAVLFSLLFIAFRFNNFVPGVIFQPLSLIGNCTLPLAMLLVGGNLARVRLGKNINIKAVSLVTLAKLIIMPLLGLLCIMHFNIPKLIGLLIFVQLAMPPAVSLSIILQRYNKKDVLISHGIFFVHMLSLVTLPLFLSLYFTYIMLK